jgi:hypothetical protein
MKKLKTHAKATKHWKEQKVQISPEITSKQEKRPCSLIMLILNKKIKQTLKRNNK